MRPSTRRPPKRPPPLEEYPSPFSVEYISVSREGGRIVKKRVLEKTKFDTHPLPETNPATEYTFPLVDAGTLQASEDVSTEQKASTVSRAVSVSVPFSCHVIVASRSIDQAL